jgi:hypothetical protein
MIENFPAQKTDKNEVHSQNQIVYLYSEEKVLVAGF